MSAAVAAGERLLVERPDRIPNHLPVARSAANLAQVLLSAGRYAEAIPAAESACRHFGIYARAFPGDTLELSNERLAQTHWAEALRGSGDPRAAAAKLIGLPVSKAADDEYLRAAGIGACLSDFETGEHDPATRELLTHWRTKALEALERAVSLGLESLHDLEHESLAPLRSEPRFQAVLEAVRRKKP